jgi:hypothetical protein
VAFFFLKGTFGACSHFVVVGRPSISYSEHLISLERFRHLFRPALDAGLTRSLVSARYELEVTNVPPNGIYYVTNTLPMIHSATSTYVGESQNDLRDRRHRFHPPRGSHCLSPVPRASAGLPRLSSHKHTPLLNLSDPVVTDPPSPPFHSYPSTEPTLAPNNEHPSRCGLRSNIYWANVKLGQSSRRSVSHYDDSDLVVEVV